jgi:hypothetical protein
MIGTILAMPAAAQQAAPAQPTPPAPNAAPATNATGGIEAVRTAVELAREDARRSFTSTTAAASAWARLERLRAPLLESDDPRAAAWRADAAEAKAHQRRGFLGVQKPGSESQRLAVVVSLHLGQGVQVDHRGPLTRKNAVVLHRLWKGVLDDAVVFGFPVNGEGVQDPGGGLSEEEPREERCPEGEPDKLDGARRDLHSESGVDWGGGLIETDSQSHLGRLLRGRRPFKQFVATQSQEPAPAPCAPGKRVP